MEANVLAQIPPGATAVILRFRSLGDTVLTTPALRLLRQARPDLRIAFVIEKAFADILEGHPDIDELIVFDRGGGLGERVRLLREVRRRRPKACLNLHGGATSAWLTALSGARWRAGWAHFRHRVVYNIRVPRAQEILGRSADAAVHTAEHAASMMFYLGAPGAEIPRASLAGEPARRENPYAVFHVTAAYFTKQWAPERFRAVASRTSERYGLEPVILAGPGEETVFQHFEGFAHAGGLSLGEMRSLLAGARLFVGNDSGPAHVAAAYGAPCVVIFGSSDSRVWRPWRTPSRVVETAWECKPCPGDRCYAFDEPKCILSVEEAAVEAAIGDLLAGQSD